MKLSAQSNPSVDVEAGKSVSIDDLVKGVRVPSENEVERIAEDAQQITTGSWAAFEERLKTETAQNTKRDRVCGLNPEVVDTFKQCNFGKSSLPDVVNAILLIFIAENKQQLRALLNPPPTLIQ